MNKKTKMAVPMEMYFGLCIGTAFGSACGNIGIGSCLRLSICAFLTLAAESSND